MCMCLGLVFLNYVVFYSDMATEDRYVIGDFLIYIYMPTKITFFASWYLQKSMLHLRG